MRNFTTAAVSFTVMILIAVIAFAVVKRPEFLATAEPRALTVAERGEPDARATDGPDKRSDVLLDPRNAAPGHAFGGGTWINSEPLKLEDLRGRVVIVDFWTYGCYNCRNTLPWLKRTYANNRTRGLTVIGVHSPESDHEKQIENVRRQVRELGVKYPVVTDNDYATWRAYGVEAWPTVVILDKMGRVRFTHIGEGAYDKMDQVIERLLAEEINRGSTRELEKASMTNVILINDSTQSDRTGKRAKETGMNDKVTKSEDEWRKQLTPEQFYVLRQKGTERPFTGEYNKAKAAGTFTCAACGNALFSSTTKFDSGTGWPSFYQPVAKANVREETDSSHGMRRTEVLCNRCGGHLGHVFDDGPKPTGLRYCINSVALKLEKK